MKIKGKLTLQQLKEKVEAEAHYRHWRAKVGEKVLVVDPKLAEWKVKQKVESDSSFLKYKTALALAEHNVTLAKSAFDALDKKANQLQSKGAMHRSELDATGMYTPTVPKKKSVKSKKKSTTPLEVKNMPDPEDPRVSAMRKIFNKKKQ